MKACLVSRLGGAWKTHNVGGLFGQHFRDAVGVETCKRVNRILDDYDGPRYPDWDAGDPRAVHEDLAFIERFILDIATSIVKGAA